MSREPAVPEAPEETALYRVYGETDLLLYIGISNNFGRRWREHAKKQPWWGEKRRLTVDEWFPFRSDAEAAEAAAIRAERPKYNKTHNVQRPAKRRSAEYLSIAASAEPPTPLATSAEVAVYLEMSEWKLATLRRQGSGPPCRILGRSPRYNWKDVEEWLAGHPDGDRHLPRRGVRRKVERQGVALDELRTLLLDAHADAMGVHPREVAA